MVQGKALTTVDPKYSSFLSLLVFLNRLDVVELGHQQHTFSHVVAMMGSFKPKPHWVPMAVVSLNVNYMELYALPRKKSC